MYLPCVCTVYGIPDELAPAPRPKPCACARHSESQVRGSMTRHTTVPWLPGFGWLLEKDKPTPTTPGLVRRSPRSEELNLSRTPTREFRHVFSITIKHNSTRQVLRRLAVSASPASRSLLFLLLVLVVVRTSRSPPAVVSREEQREHFSLRFIMTLVDEDVVTEQATQGSKGRGRARAKFVVAARAAIGFECLHHATDDR